MDARQKSYNKCKKDNENVFFLWWTVKTRTLWTSGYPLASTLFLLALPAAEGTLPMVAIQLRLKLTTKVKSQAIARYQIERETLLAQA